MFPHCVSFTSVRKLITPVTVLAAALLASLAAIGAWIATAIKSVSRLWPDLIIDASGEPLVKVVALAIVYTAAAVLLFRYRRRLLGARRGLCANCGYDLRATPHRCPECGAVPSTTNAGKRASPPL